MRDRQPTVEAILPAGSLVPASQALIPTPTTRQRRILRARAMEASLYWVCILILGCFVSAAGWIIYAARHG